MKIIIKETYDDVSKVAADMVEEQIVKKPETVLNLATGSTPLGLYSQLVTRYREKGLDFSKVTTFNLDEYLGLTPDHEQSYRYFMEDNLFKHININPSNINFLRGDCSDIEAHCREYEEKIRQSGGIDLEILGMGHNGHIGFNEPGASFDSITRCVDLTESTIQANARFFEKIDDVPRKALSMGIKTIMRAKKIILIVTGRAKAETVHKALFGRITADVPASVLQLHPNAWVLLDKEAASLIDEKELSMA
ncbi:MAG TPA: glucosamine-6-phosphate deaminase [Clostridiales bacterium]|nr:glucosamine-6-phosphate deaminase [Clostridiales bacterium]